MKTLKTLTAGFIAVALVFALVLAVTNSPVFASEKNINAPKPLTSRAKVEVAKVLNEAFVKAAWMDGLDKYETLENVSLGFAQIGDFEKALEVANAIEVKAHKINALVWLSRIQAKNGNENESYSLLTSSFVEAHKMNNSFYKADVFESLATEFENINKLSNAESLMKQADSIRKIMTAKSNSN